MDLLATVFADPTALPLWAVAVLALVMYPVGLVFSCQTCCACTLCEAGELPDTVTVTFANFVDEEEVQGPDLIAITASACFGSGFLAKATEPNGYVEEDAGPITKIEITSGGSGYAILGRVQPTLTISGGSGSGVDLDVTLVEKTLRCPPESFSLSGPSGTTTELSVVLTSNGDSPETYGVSSVTILTAGSGFSEGDILTVDIGYDDDEAVAAIVKVLAVNGAGGITSIGIDEPGAYYLTSPEIPVWELDAVTLASGGDGGSGYVDLEALTVEVAAPGTAAAPASVTCRTTRSEPALTPSAAGGSGADLVATMTEALDDQTGRPYWYVSAVSVTDGGGGYVDNAEVTFATGANGVASIPATAYARTSRSIPTLVELYGGTGTSAILTPSVTSNGTTPSTWGISSVTIDDGGAGYLQGDVLLVNLGSGDVESVGAYVTVSSVDGAGAITGVSIDYGGEYFHDDGAIESVEVSTGGAYWDDDGVIVDVVVDDGGSYYEEDAGQPPYVAAVELEIIQTAPSNGSGAELSAVIDDNPASPTFGQITAVSVDYGGDGSGEEGYLAWQWVTQYNQCCGDHYNGKSVVCLKGREGNNCEFVGYVCGTGNALGRAGRVAVDYRGPLLVPRVELDSEYDFGDGEVVSTMCSTVFLAPSLISDCDQFSFVASSDGEATATVTPGGDYIESAQNPDYTNNGYPSCHICCRGLGQSATEIEVELEDLRPGEGALSGNYFLELEFFSPWGAPGTYPDPPGYPVPIMRWKYAGDVFLEIILQTKDLQYVSSWQYLDGTEDCHRTCSVTANLIAYPLALSSNSATVATPYCVPQGSFQMIGENIQVIVQ